MSENEDLLYFNGINGATGGYGLKPMTDRAFADAILKQGKPGEEAFSFRAMYGIDEKELSQTGWGIIFPYDPNNPEVSDARVARLKDVLGELIAHRQAQVNNEKLFKIFEGPKKQEGGYVAGQSKADFLKRKGVGSGSVDPKKGVPYYLLLVGSPDEIPYRFQNELDVQYAVGRIDFGDDWRAYANYAHSVVTAETSPKIQLPRKVSFFGVESSGDRATEMSSKYLIQPLYKAFQEMRSDWAIEGILAERAVKARLGNLLGGKEMPALLFTASHGMEFPKGDTRQFPSQGALLCSDWPGPGAHRGAIPEDFYFSGHDIASNQNLLGLLAFFFACYGAGTPELDEFSKQAFNSREPIAPKPFLAQLPSRMLSHPKGGALAVIGHVERAWGYSFMVSGAGPQTTLFEETIQKLLDGYPIGTAIETTNERYAELATELTTTMEEMEYDLEYVSPRELAAMWTSHNDARGYVIIGDPAVRLSKVGNKKDAAMVERPEIVLSASVAGKLAAEISPAASMGTRPDASESEVEPVSGVESFSAEVDFSIQVGGLTDTLKNFTDKIVEAVGKATQDITTLQVRTYSTDDLDSIKPGDDSAAKLRALTHIEFDGDMKVFIPTKEGGGVDEAVWAIHKEMVHEAQANRAEFIGALVEMASNLLKTLK
ncbi:MAG: hypothetical protein JXA33_11060 [Anaerolineae bacterium]|nr:hypothetical protein [Anaerolineae bacterium]